MNEQQTPAMTEQEVARRLGLSVATLRAWRLRRRGPRYVRFGRAVRYLASDIERFVQTSAVDHGSARVERRSRDRKRRTQVSLWKRGRRVLGGLHGRRPSVPKAPGHGQPAGRQAAGTEAHRRRWARRARGTRAGTEAAVGAVDVYLDAKRMRCSPRTIELERNGSSSSSATSATCPCLRSRRGRSRTSSGRGTRPASRTARSTWTSACCRAC